MQDLWKLVGSPRHLLIFEAAARHGSFTRAASEMNVQQPAVSAAIKRLEGTLGSPLFQRAHKRVQLTPAGAKFYSEVSKALHQIQDAAREMQGEAQKAFVTLSASTAFNTYWMLPQLRTLHQTHQGIDLRLQSSDREPDIDAEGISLAVRRGYGDWQDCHAELLAEDVIYPIASPSLLDLHSLERKEDILDHTLIHLEEPIRERPSWKDWFYGHNVSATIPTAGLRLNDYALVLNAAISGEGIAFGWHHLTRDLINNNLLHAREDWAWRTGQAMYLVWSKTHPLSTNAKRVRDWILSRRDT